MLLVRETMGRVMTREKISAKTMAATAAMRKYMVILSRREYSRSIISCREALYSSTPMVRPPYSMADAQ